MQVKSSAPVPKGRKTRCSIYEWALQCYTLKVRSLSSFEFSKKIYIFFYYIYPSFLFLQQEKILLTLETDEGVLNNLPTAIWKRLTVV